MNSDAPRSFGWVSLRWAWLSLFVASTAAFLTSGLRSLPDDAWRGDAAAGANPSPVALQPDSDRVAGGPADPGLPADPGWDASIQTLDAAWAETLAARGLTATEPADWLAVCRRQSLALVGTGVSLQEIRALERLPESDRPRAHLDALLRDPRFHDYWAERWTRFFVGADEGPFLVYRRRRFRIWLAEQIAANVRYDRIARQLLTARGLWTDRPEVNFWTVTFDSGDGQPDPERMAARVSRVFLGLRIDCLQCHDDFLGNVSLGDVQTPRPGLQSDFHQLAAFLSAAESDGLQGIRDRPAEYRYQFLDAEEPVSVEPAVPYQPELLPDRGGDRRRFAVWATHPQNRQAAKAAVSHFWALMFGRPMSASIDDLPLGYEGPRMLEALADDFIAHGYDVHRLIRVIGGSAPFRLSSSAGFEVTPEVEAGWAVFPIVRLRPEQVAGRLIQAARLHRVGQDSSFLIRLQKYGSINDFVKRFGDLGEDEFVNESVTVSQRLVLLNGKMIDESIEANPVLNASAHIAMFAGDDERAVETAYLTVLNRYPAPRERDHFRSRLASADDRGEAMIDLFWVLMNGSEFGWNH